MSASLAQAVSHCASAVPDLTMMRSDVAAYAALTVQPAGEPLN